MGAVLSLLGLRSDTSTLFPSFERALEILELRIQRNQERLASIKARERWAVSTVSLYVLAAWGMYVGVWWAGLAGVVATLFGFQFEGNKVVTALEAVPVWLMPLSVMFLRRLFRWWYRRKKEAEEEQLRSLKKQLRDKVEELKKQTSYYSTRTLLERYDEKVRQNEGKGRGAPLPPQNGPGAGRPGPGLQGPSGTPGRPLTPTPNPMHIGASHGSQPLRRSPHSASQSPGSRGWADRFADVLLGDDEQGPDRRYALICGQCFSHNGLVLKEELYQLQYRCPQCGFLNPPKPRPQSPSSNPKASSSVPTSPSSHHLSAPLRHERDPSRRKSSPADPGRSGKHDRLPSHDAGSDDESDDERDDQEPGPAGGAAYVGEGEAEGGQAAEDRGARRRRVGARRVGDGSGNAEGEAVGAGR